MTMVNPRRLDRIYVFLIENSDGDEGIAAYASQRRLEPMVASTQEKLDQLLAIAGDLVKSNGRPIRVVRFFQREDIGLIQAPLVDA